MVETDDISPPTEQSDSPAQFDSRATVSIQQRVRPGRERDFEEFIRDIVQDAWRFAGFQNVNVSRPILGDRNYRILLRYDSEEHLRNWMESDVRNAYEARRAELIESAPLVRNITGTSQERPLAIALMPIGDFVQTTVSGIGLLLAGTLAALLMVNFGMSEQYERLWTTHLTIGTPSFGLQESLRHWVNDGLMALFFFIVGLEIKREVLVGDLRSLRSASLPIAAALGGVLLPATLYFALNSSGDGSRGWGIPMATDTAFSIGILTLMGARVQPLLLVFLTAFAIVDDIFAVLVIALFYTDQIVWTSMAAAALVLALLVLANLAGFHQWPVYALLGLFAWLAIFDSGVHGTLAGILVAMTVPARSWINPREFIVRARELLEQFERSCGTGDTILSNEGQQRASQELETLVEQVETPMTHLQHRLNPWVAFGVLPLFAFANAGISISEGFGDALSSSVAWGVILGLVVAKPIGIAFFAWMAVRLGITTLPPAIDWRQIIGVATLGGIGFTMSLFVTELAFGPGPLADAARVGILVGSIVAGTIAYFVLDLVLPRDESQDLDSAADIAAGM